MLTQEQLDIYKKALEEEKARILRDIQELEAPPDFGDEPGPEDDIDEAESSYNNQASANSYRTQLAEVEAALGRMEKGTYGVCEKTGRDIPPEVLAVNPTARFHPDYLKEENK